MREVFETISQSYSSIIKSYSSIINDLYHIISIIGLTETIVVLSALLICSIVTLVSMIRTHYTNAHIRETERIIFNSIKTNIHKVNQWNDRLSRRSLLPEPKALRQLAPPTPLPQPTVAHKWYIQQNGMERGPFTATQLKKFLTSGEAKSTDFISLGRLKWITAGKVIAALGIERINPAENGVNLV